MMRRRKTWIATIVAAFDPTPQYQCPDGSHIRRVARVSEWATTMLGEGFTAWPSFGADGWAIEPGVTFMIATEDLSLVRTFAEALCFRERQHAVLLTVARANAELISPFPEPTP